MAALPLTDRDGKGLCLGCHVDLAHGRPHKPGCPIDKALRDDIERQHRFLVEEKRLRELLADPHNKRAVRDLANKIRSMRRITEQVEFDKAGAGRRTKP
jgi:hypothetical protein